MECPKCENVHVNSTQEGTRGEIQNGGEGAKVTGYSNRFRICRLHGNGVVRMLELRTGNGLMKTAVKRNF
jgi:hypothetical protein